MKNKLLPRFIVILATIVLAILCLKEYPLKGGPDLAGGTSLLYELQLPPGTRDPAQIATEVIATIRNRIDPLDQKNLIFRVVGGRRIQLQIPAASKESSEARRKFRDAEQALTDSGVTPQIVVNISKLQGEARKAEIAKYAKGWKVREDLLTDLAQLLEDQRKTQNEADELAKAGTALSAELMGKMLNLEKTIQDKQGQLQAHNANATKVKTLLESIETGSVQSKKELDQMMVDFPAQKTEIEGLKRAGEEMAKYRDQSADDPEEIKRLLRGSGKLDFRIVVRTTDLGVDIPEAITTIQNFGPRRPVGNTRWYEVDQKSADNFASNTYVVMPWGGKNYVLLYTDKDQALSHDIPGQDWSLTEAHPQTDDTGKLLVAFRFNDAGKYLFGALTTTNKGRAMAILLDDRAISAPNINEPILGGSGTITMGANSGKAVQDEVDNLVKTLRAGSLRAALSPEPISEEHIDPQIGGSNITAGLNSAIIAVIAVMAFMVVYYTITGMFANLALALNLLITLAVMAFIGATFTLSGIAGIVLTLGMAVDANVLINERIREEVHKGGSLWMAVKQGYDKVFWTIFDANLTTSLTSIVLILVGSEGVKGFGVTLLIGLIIHMFTALFVTRTLMIAAIRWNILKQIDDHSVGEYVREIFTGTWLRMGKWPFMRVIHVTNINWISKRHYFWAVSGVITVLGLWAFVHRGEDKYDTEFRGGTQVTFRTQTPQTDKEVRDQIHAMGSDPELLKINKDFAELKEALVYPVRLANAPASPDGKSTTFQLQTVLSDTSTVKVKQVFLDALAVKFPNPAAKQKITIANIGDELSPTRPELDAVRKLKDAGQMVPLTNGTLSRNFSKVQITASTRTEIFDYIGGIGIYLDGINPPQSIETLEGRLRAARLTLSSTARASDIVGVKEAGNGLYSSVVLLAKDEQITYDTTNTTNGFNEVEEQEMSTLLESLQPKSPFDAVNSIDAVVAGQAKGHALLAIVISLTLIVIYVWIRFGGLRYGIGAILSLAHDAIVALAATVLATYVCETAIGKALLITDFKINLTMIAAYLTIIGYSVNDTIVIFDRIRENRGRGKTPLDAKLINDSINQCFGRTIWTTFTVFIVLMIMYIFGGEGVHGFAFAMLIGVLTGAYSTLAIASPMLLNIKDRDPEPETKAIVKKKTSSETVA